MRFGKGRSLVDDHAPVGGNAAGAGEALHAMLRIWREFSRSSEAALASKPQIMVLGASALNLLPAKKRSQALAEALSENLALDAPQAAAWLLSLGPVEEPRLAMSSKALRLACLADFDHPDGLGGFFPPLLSWCSLAAASESLGCLLSLESAGFGARDRERLFDGLASQLSCPEARASIFETWHPWVALMVRGGDEPEFEELLATWRPKTMADAIAANSAVLKICCDRSLFDAGPSGGIERLAAEGAKLSAEALDGALSAFAVAFVRAASDEALLGQAEDDSNAMLSWMRAVRGRDYNSAKGIVALSALFSKMQEDSSMGERVFALMNKDLLAAIEQDYAYEIADWADGLAMFASWSKSPEAVGWAAVSVDAWVALSSEITAAMAADSGRLDASSRTKLERLLRACDGAAQRDASFYARRPRL